MNIYVYFQSHDLFNSNATYLDNSIGHFIKMCKDSHLQHHELEEIHLNWFAVNIVSQNIRSERYLGTL